MRIVRRLFPSLRARVLAFACLGLAAPAISGPPFVSDDPEPTDLGHWEIYAFTGGTHVPGETDGAAGFDINYGGAKDLQLTAVLPLNYQTGADGAVGIGNIELAAKYKFLHQSDGSPIPDVAFFPRAFLPTAGHRFGTRRLSILLPLWAQKDFGKWSLFGGGGYDINPGPGQRNFWLTGIGLQRAISDRFALGAEVYRQTADADDARRFTGVNVGALYRLSKHWSLIGSAGPGVEHARTQGRYAFYAALKADY
jgi:hypothetical protein